ncbi:Fc.00g024370.m01.CDS01 [Cosmosporella sp. VM-42]
MEKLGVPSSSVAFGGNQSSEAGKGIKNAASAKKDHSAFAEPFPRQPSLSLPKGGGALRPIDDKFQTNAANGSGTMTIPIGATPARSGSAPALTVDYDSGSGNGPFGMGWSLSNPSISRRTDKGWPTYNDEVDTFVLTGREDLVPVLTTSGFQEKPRDGYTVRRYRPRIESAFTRIERWKSNADPADIHWRTIDADNSMTIYGMDADSRVTDPLDRTRIFKWLVSANYDTSGNAIIYRYKAENSDNVPVTTTHENNRTSAGRSSNRYLKSIVYGNRKPMKPSLAVPLAPEDWMFELVFDFGEHDEVDPKPDDPGTWNYRQDPVSSYSPTFEVRTYRLCRRVLMFHRFPDELGEPVALVRSTTFTYNQSPTASFLISVVLSGHVRRQLGQPYVTKSLPPTEFEYSTAPTAAQLEGQSVSELDAKSLENLSTGVNGTSSRWIDLNGEGLPSVLSESANAWFYKRNTSASNRTKEATDTSEAQTEARFSPLSTVQARPRAGSLDSDQVLLADLDGDGLLELVEWREPTPSVYLHNQDSAVDLTGDNELQWKPSNPYESWPNIDLRNPETRLVDLTGDGLPDLLQVQGNVLYWYPSLGRRGFGPRRETVAEGPAALNLAFDNAEGTVYLADMSGSGLSDLVCIKNGIISYWPNLGYGRFGAQIVMDKPPWITCSDTFDHRRIRLADVDGSGTADFIYLTSGGFNLYRNLGGNGWANPETYSVFPHIIQDLTTVEVIDILGNGTVCLVWSSKLPSDAGHQMLYLDMMGGIKPHLMTRVRNNFGGETGIHYAPSTYFSLRDSEAGRPWATKLPFPVQCVEKVVSLDRINRTRFTSRFEYHHGCFDGEERELRGFASVEQWDTEELDAIVAQIGEETELPANLDEASFSPPVHVKTWFHTGVHVGRKDLSHELATEYYGAPPKSSLFFKSFLGNTLPVSNLPELNAELTDQELSEACRALKGLMLRKEVYVDDASIESDDEARARALRPYSITESRYKISLMQHRGQNRHAVFLSQPCEGITQNLERSPDDPRVNHSIILDVNEFGKVKRSLKIVYGRQRGISTLDPADAALQEQLHLLYNELDYTNAIDEDDTYRQSAPCESRLYELTGFSPSDSRLRFRLSDFDTDDFAVLKNATSVPFENRDTTGTPQKRLLSRVRTLFRSDDLTSLLPLAKMESRALPGEAYALALTPGLLSSVYKRTNPDGTITDLLPNPSSVLGSTEGGYKDLDGDGSWWTSAGRIYYHPDPIASPDTELKFAEENFFLPCRFTDIFGNSGTVEFDDHKLLTMATHDAYDNRSSATNDYRMLQPRIIQDPNGNRAEVAFDALGVVVGSAIMGKEDERVGDSLIDFNPDITQAEIDEFFTSPRRQISWDLLKNATSRVVYDLDKFWREPDPLKKEPVFTSAIARETHSSDLVQGRTSIQVSFAYHGGFNQVIQNKAQAEPGSLVDGGPTVSPRWLGSGWTITNNKDLPIKQYEAFFDDTHTFKYNYQNGVSQTIFYDSMSRVVGNLGPNHSFSKVKFDAWFETTYDCNDTTRIVPKEDPDIGSHFRRLKNSDYLPTWYGARINGDKGPEAAAAAASAAKHANTPSTVHLDSLGRAFLSILDNGSDRKYLSRMVLDIQGNRLQGTDSKGRLIQKQDYDMLGNVIHDASMESGESWVLTNALGGGFRTWNLRGFVYRTTFDKLQRLVEQWVSEEGRAPILVQRTTYGESQTSPDPHKNTRTRVIRMEDQSGVLENEGFDFKGNLLSCSRQLSTEYKKSLDWSTNVPLEATKYSFAQKYNALNRVTEQLIPDGSTFRPLYNEAALLGSLQVNLKGEKNAAGNLKWTEFVKSVEYDFRGLRKQVHLGNQTQRIATHEDDTARLIRLQTVPVGGGNALQDLNYTHDPVGNITQCRDDAQQTIFFRNAIVEPTIKHVYDALYRLSEATGREHLGQNRQASAPKAIDTSRTRLVHRGDRNAMALYTESYEYDSVGNILGMKHVSSDASSGSNWTRRYNYNEKSQLEPAKVNNRLSFTQIGNETETYRYAGSNAGLHGLATSLPQLPFMEWNEQDQLRASSQQIVNGGGTPEITYYCYGNGGQRIRKVTERQAAAGSQPIRLKERIYLGIFEIYREYGGDGNRVDLERETLHVMDDQTRVALVESRTKGTDQSPPRLIRYQYSNLVGSSALELDDAARIISYQEYYPYGATSYQAVSSVTQVPKRFQFCGKEREEETGLDYSGARYYAPWIGRWISADPGGLIDGSNLYRYAQCNPITMSDPSGYQTSSSESQQTERNVWTSNKKGSGPGGRMTQDEVRRMYANSPEHIIYTGDATEVSPNHWTVDESQITSRGVAPSHPKNTPTEGKEGSGGPAKKPAPAAPAAPKAAGGDGRAAAGTGSGGPGPGAGGTAAGTGSGTGTGPGTGTGSGSGGTGTGGGGEKDGMGLVGHFAVGFATGLVTGFIGGLAIAALLGGGPIAVGIGIAAILVGAFMTGQTIGELIFGNPSPERKAEIYGGLAGGLVGGMMAGGIFGRLKGSTLVEEGPPGAPKASPVETPPPEPPVSAPAEAPPAAGAGPPAPPPPAAPAGSLLRVSVIDQLMAAVTKSAADVDAAIAAGNRGYFQRLGQSPKQIDAIMRGTRMWRGNAVQAALIDEIAKNPLLSLHIEVLVGARNAQGQFVSTPDFLLKFPDAQFYADLTTSNPRTVGAHLWKYGSGLLVLIY